MVVVRLETVAATPTYAKLTGAVGEAYLLEGRLRQMMLGNNLWETRRYRPPSPSPDTPGTHDIPHTQLMLGVSPGTGERLESGYDYHATQNNGNLTGHTITRSGTTWTQTFGYDG